MWVCPKCGREFQRNNQGHFCGQPPKTVDEYIAQQERHPRPIWAKFDKLSVGMRRRRLSGLPGVCQPMNRVANRFLLPLAKSISVFMLERRLLNIFKQNWLDLRIKRTLFICSMPRNCRLNCWQKLLSGVWEISEPK